MQNVIVRPETPADFAAIEVVHLSAFEGAQEAGVVQALRSTPDFVPELSLVAESHNRIVGHALLSKARLQRNGQTFSVLALGPMAVVPSHSHRGIGSRLVDAAVETARRLGFSGIVAAGQQGFYRRCGFVPGDQWGLHANLDVSDRALAAFELKDGALARGGDVIYPPAFFGLYRRPAPAVWGLPGGH